MHRPRSVREADVAGKRVLVRSDLNVPLDDGEVADDTRIRASLPTLQHVLDGGAAHVAVCSHLGRPQGRDPAFAMAPVEARLRELLPDDRLEVLENTRFSAGETTNDPETARTLAEGRDLYVNDAFGSAHRAHASTEGVAHLLPAYAGLLLERELEMLGRLLGDVERPFVLVAGGAKVDDKLGVLVELGGRADSVLVGGKMAEELRDENPLPYEAELPSDVVAAAAFEEDAESRVAPYDDLPNGWLGLDIGPETRKRFARDPRIRTYRFLERPDGRLRVAALRGGHEGGGRGGCGGGRLHGRRRRRLGARAPRPRRSPTGSRGSPPVAARRSSSSRASSFPASRRYRRKTADARRRQLEDVQGAAPGARVRRADPPAPRALRGRRRRRLPSVRLARGDPAGARAGERGSGVRTERPLGARGGVHRRGRAADARRARRHGRDRRPLGAPPAVRRDRRRGRASRGGGARGRAARHRVRRGDGSRARGGGDRGACSSASSPRCRVTSGW